MTTQPPSDSTSAEAPEIIVRRRESPIVVRLASWGTIIALAALIITFTIASPLFLTSANVNAVLAQSAELAIIASGLTLCLISWDFDLSVGAMATLSGITLGLLLQHGFGVPAAIAVAMLLGTTVGLTNGLIVARLNVSAFIGTLATMTILEGFGDWWSSSATVPITDAGFLKIAFAKVAGVPVPAILAAVVFVLLWVVLERTKFGRLLYAVGANPQAARIAGVRVKTVRIAAFIGTSTLAAGAGVLLASQLSGAYHGAGEPFLLNAYAAVFLGAVTLRLGQFHIVGTMVGVLILSVLANGLAVLSTPSWVTQVATGGILIAAVSLSGLSRSLVNRSH